MYSSKNPSKLIHFILAIALLTASLAGLAQPAVASVSSDASVADSCSGSFVIDSSQEVPSNSSTASGTGTYSYDSATMVLSWSISFTGVTATGIHFHGPAMPGVNAGVEVNVGGISGLSSPLMGSTTLTAAQASDLLDGLWYLNIHSDAFPGGEIRGQLPACQPLAIDLVQTDAIDIANSLPLIAILGLVLSLLTVFVTFKKLNNQTI